MLQLGVIGIHFCRGQGNERNVISFVTRWMTRDSTGQGSSRYLFAVCNAQLQYTVVATVNNKQVSGMEAYAVRCLKDGCFTSAS